MRAVVLAAGKGSRLGRLTSQTPKPMLKVNGRPVIEHNIRLLTRGGVNNIYINLNHMSDVITEYFKDGAAFGARISYSYEDRLLGTAGAVRRIADLYWKSLERFIVLYADNLFECSIGDILAFHEAKKGMVTIAVHEKADLRASGAVKLGEGGNILSFVEKSIRPEQVAGLANAGLYVLEPESLGFMPVGKALDFGRNVFPEMLGSGVQMYGIKIKGLTAIDTPELYHEAMHHPKNREEERA